MQVTFKHRCVRDLAWVIGSPPLIAGEIDGVQWWSHTHCINELHDCLPALKTLDENPQPLLAHLATLKNRRLGSVFEGFISFWLSISPNYRLRQQNIQLIKDKHTFGEIDFIIEDLRSGVLIHLEVAVKFYLGSPPFTDAYRWFGTNTKDQLGKKFNHLRRQQTQLSNTHAELLQHYFPQAIEQRHCILKGRLFYPFNEATSPENIPIAPKHLRGRWCYSQQRNPAAIAIKIDKAHWLAELSAADCAELGVTDVDTINTIDRAECFVELDKGAEQNGLMEKQRIFYLPDGFRFPE